VGPIDEKRALEIALAAARDSYGEVEEYEISVDEIDGEWRVRFQLPGAPEDGGSSHFAVWIDKNSGEARLFRGR
jgi:hypothetical protein